MKKSISVIIPNYCGKALLEKYLPSVFSALESSINISAYEVIVVDDASTDSSIDFLEENFPSVILIKSPFNQGFSKTSNLGISSAKYDLVLMLNNDMQVATDFFDTLIPLFISNENIFGVFSKIYDASHQTVLEAQKLPLIKSSEIRYADNISASLQDFSFYLCGGNMLLDRNKLVALKGFNTIYSPFYFEDFDLSIRAWKRGWECVFSPDTYSLHCHSATINTKFTSSYVGHIFIRNRFIFNLLHLDGKQLVVFTIKNFFKFFLFLFIPTKSHLQYIKSLYSAVVRLPQIVQQRRIDSKVNALSVSTVIRKYFK